MRSAPVMFPRPSRRPEAADAAGARLSPGLSPPGRARDAHGLSGRALWLSVAGAAFLAAAADPASASEYDAQINALIDSSLQEIAADPAVIEVVKGRNDAPKPDQATIDQLDADWKAEVGGNYTPLIDTVTSGPVAARLMELRDDSDGLITEILVMDNVGLNIAISDVTSDYWQGDEAKWQETYLVGPDARHISEVDLDESTQTYQLQVSLPVNDPDDGDPIGAITFGIDVEALP